MKLFSLLGLPFLMITLCCPHGLCADSSLDKKHEESLLFHQYVQKKLALQHSQADSAKNKFWRLITQAFYGYDNNPRLNSRHKGDSFHEENLYASVWMEHPDLIGYLRAGQFGVSGKIVNRDYFHMDAYDNLDAKISPFITSNLTDTLTLKAEGLFRFYNYFDNDGLSNFTQGFRISLREVQFRPLKHTLYYQFANKNYDKRKALSAFNTELDYKRDDTANEIGYQCDSALSRRISLGALVAWKLNESNDIYQDYNDSSGFRGAVYSKVTLTQRLSWSGLFGYDYKKYASRTFPEDPSSKEHDDYIYLSSSLIYELNKNCDLILSYAYQSNESNNPLMNFCGSVYMIGLSYEF